MDNKNSLIRNIAIVVAITSAIILVVLIYLIYIEPTTKKENISSTTTITITTTKKNPGFADRSTTTKNNVVTTTKLTTITNITTTTKNSVVTTNKKTLPTTTQALLDEKTTTATHMSTVTINGKTTFGVVSEDTKGNMISFELDCKKFNIPTHVADYKDYIYYNVTYYYTNGKTSYNSKDIKSVKVMDYKTKKQITGLSKSNLEKLYNPEVNTGVITKNWQKEIKLSTLKAGQIYSFKSTTKITEPPKVINDLGKNVKLSIKTPMDDAYEEEYSIYRKIDSGFSISATYEEYEVGDTFNIMYTAVTTKEIIDNTDEDDIVFLSDYPSKGEIDYTFKKVIYNDTSKAIKLRFIDSFYGQNYNELITINAGEVVAFNWMMDSIEFE